VLAYALAHDGHHAQSAQQRACRRAAGVSARLSAAGAPAPPDIAVT
jgi:hypothetical protein